MLISASRFLRRKTVTDAATSFTRSFSNVDSVFDHQRTYTRPRTLIRVETLYMKNSPVSQGELALLRIAARPTYA